MKISICAKINLALEVTGKRPDGYHTLSSIMQSVSLCDEVELKESDTFSVACSKRSLSNKDNLAYKAAEMFFESIGVSPRIDIYIHKNIPLTAGLGGGSADAAAVLFGLNEMNNRPLSDEELAKIALSLGTDVLFCMNGGTLLCEGIGEVMTKLPSLLPCNILIAIKGQKSSTRDMYRALDEISNLQKPDIKTMISCLKNSDLKGFFNVAYNSFEAVWENEIMDSIKQVAMNNNALYCGISGAGPSIISVFEDENDVLLAEKVLRNMGCETYICHPTKKSIRIIE